MVNLETITTIIGATGGTIGITGLATVRAQARKLRAETRHLDITTTTTASAAGDQHWQTLIAAHTTHLLTPLQDEVARLGARLSEQDHHISEQDQHISALRTELAAQRCTTDLLATYLRALLTWARRQPHNPGDPIPTPPPGIPIT
jgi:uncharacterized coiled-coil protein SlyX